MNKQGTPTMGGLIILGAILLPTLLFADLTNVYTQLMILATLWLGTIGFIDDYIKVFKKNKEGLAAFQSHWANWDGCDFGGMMI